MKIHKKSLAIMILFMALAVPAVVFCQPPPLSNDVDTPIDGGISLLVAAGAIIGAKKVKDARKNK